MRKSICLLAIFLAFTNCSRKPSGVELISGFQNVARLATMEVQVHKIIAIEKTKKVFSWTIGKSNQVVSSDAIVKIGVDLNELQSEDVQIKGDEIKITLPAVKVVDFIYPPSQFELLAGEDAGFASLTIENIDEGYRKAELDIRKWLNNLGLDQAGKARNRRFFRNFLRSLGYKHIDIQFKSPEDKNHPLIVY